MLLLKLSHVYQILLLVHKLPLLVKFTEKSWFCSRRMRKAAKSDTNTRKRKKMKRELEMRKKRRRRNHQGPRKQELWTILRPSWRVKMDQETVRVEIMKNSRAPSNQSGFDINTVWHRQVIFQSIPPVLQCLTFWITTAFLFFQHRSFTLCFLKIGTWHRCSPHAVFQSVSVFSDLAFFR